MQVKARLEATSNDWNQAGRIAIAMTPKDFFLISLSRK